MLSKKDQEFYRKVFRRLQDCLEPVICLSGHTHVWEDVEEGNKHHYVAKRFSWVTTVKKSRNSNELEQVRYLNYGVCEIPTVRPCPKDEIKYYKREEELTS